MTRADDLRAEAVRLVNGYILDNLDPGLDQYEDEALAEAGDIVDLVLDLAYRRTRADLDEAMESYRRNLGAAWRGEPLPDPEPTQQAWFESWPATFYTHHSGEEGIEVGD